MKAPSCLTEHLFSDVVERMAGPPIVRDAAGVAEFLARVSHAPFLAVDTETSGLDPHADRLLLIQVGTAEEQCLIDANAVDAAAIQPIFRPDRTVVLHNASFDLKMLWGHYGLELDLIHARIADTLQNEKLLLSGRKSSVVLQGFSLKQLADRYAGMELDKSIRQGFYGIQSIEDLSEAELYYALRDVEATWKVLAKQLPQLSREGLMRVAGIEGAACLGFAMLEYQGAPLDSDAWKSHIEAAKAGSAAARKALDDEFGPVADRDLFGGTTINYDNDEEVIEALAKLGVHVPGVRREVLQATGHSAAIRVAEYREHQRIVSTYGDTFLAHVHAQTKRLHPSFRAIGATTGRASCSEPNLQSIPAGSEFRSCFRAPAGRKLITADYAGAELRILAQVSGDPVFLHTLLDGGDLHSMVASRLFGVAVSKQENPHLRARAKAVNFGLAYGMGPPALADQLGIGEHEAADLLERYFAAFPKIRRYLEDAAQTALRNGFSRTLGGRTFWFVDMRNENRPPHAMARVAKNMPIQGTNADIVKLAMARITVALAEQGLDAFLVNMVHDEILVESASDDAEAARDVVVKEMMSAGAEFVRRVPMTVDAQIGDTWLK